MCVILLHLFVCLFIFSLTEEIRTFAASLPGWLKTALKDLPELLVKTKEKGKKYGGASDQSNMYLPHSTRLVL